MSTTLDTFYKEKIVPSLQKSRGYKNVHQVPKLEKVVVNCCIGSCEDVKIALEDAIRDVTLITGQKPLKTTSKKSIAKLQAP